jgi:hypothetical protein
LIDGNGSAPKTPPNYPTFFFFIMTRDLAISLLRQGNTGTEILNILDTIESGGDDSDTPTPTMEEIQF